MKRSVILYDIPQEAVFADIERIAAHLGLRTVPGRFGYGYFNAEGCLYSFYHGAPSRMWQDKGIQHIQFIHAADDANRALPMARWRSGEPPMVGEWNGSCDRLPDSLRWWNGEWWSAAYKLRDTEETKAFARNKRSCWQTSDVYWRGPTEQPITAGFAK